MQNSEFVVRPAKKSDQDALITLMYEYIVYFYQGPKPPLEKLQKLVQTLQDGKEGVQFVAEQNGELVGFATLYFTYSTLRAQKVAIMNDLYAVEKARGTGAGAALFKACHAYTKENDYAYMSWETARDNTRAQRFYEKMGGSFGDWLTYSI